MANSSDVLKEGDGIYKRRVKEEFVRRGLGLSYICMPAPRPGRSPWAKKKKFHSTGELEREPGGGMMMLDGCAGLGEHGRRKDKSK
jgi:hypothetical protein